MSNLREQIKEKIEANRPKLAPNSLKTYVSILFNLHKNSGTGPDDQHIDWFHEHEKEILDSLKEKPSQTRKSILSALYILTNREEFRKQMIEDCKVTNDNYKNQKMNAKEKENWINVEDIENLFNELTMKIKAMFAGNKVVEYGTIMEFFLVACLGGVSGLPPRRSLDYALMKIRNYDIKTDNYYKAGKFYFNKYKTHEKYGLQVLQVPKELNSLIKKWIKLNENDYLLFSSNKNHLSSSQITRILNGAFGGKHVSTDMLRHIFLTNKYQNIPALKDMEELATQMSHSLNTALQYVKHE